MSRTDMDAIADSRTDHILRPLHMCNSVSFQWPPVRPEGVVMIIATRRV